MRWRWVTHPVNTWLCSFTWSMWHSHLTRVKIIVLLTTLDTTCRFTLWWRSPLVMNSRGTLQFDWPRATLLYGGGLHHGQETFGEEHCTWMKRMTWMPTWWTLFRRGVLWRSSFLGNLKASARNLTSGELQLESNILLSCHRLRHTIPQITMSWA